MDDFDDILDRGFTQLTGEYMKGLNTEGVERLADTLVGDVMNAYVEDFRRVIRQGLIDRINASLDVEKDNWKFIYRDRFGYGTK